MEKLKHKNIVRFFEYLKTQNNNYIILEYIEGGDLSTFLREQKRFSEFAA